MKKLKSVTDNHQEKICVGTLRCPPALRSVIGGPNATEARAFLRSIGYTEARLDSLERRAAR